MLIPGVPLEVKVEQEDHSFLVYSVLEDVVPQKAQDKAKKIIDSPMRVSKIIIKLSQLV